MQEEHRRRSQLMSGKIGGEAGRERGEAGYAQPDAEARQGSLGWCKYCGERIYWLHFSGRGWRPFESWVEGNAAEGEWIYHDCR
jgi:hypothetical protein